MPICGNGMLVTSMDIPSTHEQEFNRWYDEEHLAERVAIDGFIEARRYIAHKAEPKYFCLYSTATFDVLTSEPYRRALANQTEWSRLNISRFRNMGRALARISISRGRGRGAALGVLRLRPNERAVEEIRDKLRPLLTPEMSAGIVSLHLLESDPTLSKSLTNPAASDPGAGDWMVLIDGVDVAAVAETADRLARELDTQLVRLVSIGTYRLLWDLAKCELSDENEKV